VGPELRDELSIGGPVGPASLERPRPPRGSIAVAERPLEPLVGGPVADEDEGFFLADPIGDGRHEAVEMLDSPALRRAGAIPAVAASGQRIGSHMAGRAMVGRHVRGQALDPGGGAIPTDDDGLSRIDPDEGASRPADGEHAGLGLDAGGHERAQAGVRSSAAARSS